MDPNQIAYNNQSVNQPQKPNSKKFLSSNMILVLVIVMIVLILSGLGAFFFLNSSKKTAVINNQYLTSNSQSSSKSTQQTEIAGDINNVVNTVDSPLQTELGGKIFIYTKENNDLKVLDIVSKKETLIGNGHVVLGPGTGLSGESLSPNGRFLLYGFSETEIRNIGQIKRFIYDFENQKSYPINFTDNSLKSAMWSEDSKSILFYSLGDKVQPKLLEINSNNLTDLTPRDIIIPPEFVLGGNFKVRKFLTENEIWVENPKYKQQIAQTLAEAREKALVRGGRLTEDQAKLYLQKVNYEVEIDKLDLITGKSSQIPNSSIPLSQLDQYIYNCLDYSEYIAGDNLTPCLDRISAPGKLYISLVNFQKFSEVKRVELTEIAWNNTNNSVDAFLIPIKSRDKIGIVILIKKKSSFSISNKLFFRSFPDFKIDNNIGVVEFQSLNPNFNRKKRVQINAISPKGNYIVFIVDENCQPSQGCDENYYLYDLIKKKMSLIYTDQSNTVKEIILTGG